MKIILLAGGKGERLWPLSRSHFPKQFLHLGHKESLLRQTLLRNLAVAAPEEIFILTHENTFHEVVKEAKELPLENIIAEPASKNTCGAIVFALKMLEKRIEKKETLLIVPSDHLISPLEKYAHYVKEANTLAGQGNIVIFGVPPTHPETGFGYIKTKKTKEGFEFEKFVEKPNIQSAKQYLFEGNYFWNSGMFAFTKEVVEKELEEHSFDHFSFLQKKSSPESFLQLPSLSFDYAVMEKTKKIAMIPLELTWSDVGSWNQVYEVLDKDEMGNATFGDVKMINTKNSLILAQKRLVSTIGVENLVIIETEDALLIMNKEEGQKVKELVESLKKEGKKEVEELATVNRPWGSYTVLETKERYKIKRIEVIPLQKLSLQLHYHRSEHWIVVKGSAKVTINEKESYVHEGESIFVPKTALHRIENPGKVTLEIIEVQVGEYLGEDDIVRLEDIYGRLKAKEAFNILKEHVK